MAICFFSQSETHREFSNFAPFGIDLDEAHWPSVEHYYQAQKFADPQLRKLIRKAAKPVIAKNLADKNKAAIRPDWDAVKDEVCIAPSSASSSCIRSCAKCCWRPAPRTSSNPRPPITTGAWAVKAPDRTGSARSSNASARSCNLRRMG
jgi:ADP-ribose binding protein with NADAR domain